MFIEQVKKLTPKERLLYWINERSAILVRKNKGLEKPWTDDIILSSYRFCNVHREDDTVTQWIAKNWREPNTDEPDLWFSMCIARLVNLPACLKDLDYQTRWNPGDFISTLHSRRECGLPMFNGAYIVSTNGKSMDKAEYVANNVLAPLWERREELRPKSGTTLGSWAELLGSNIGMGTFMSGQVVADLKYASGCPLSESPDWRTWAAPGPGSKRGLNRVYGRDPDTSWGKLWLPTLQKLRTEPIKNRVVPTLGGTLHAQDLQSCLCEFDKYERALWNQGTPKQRYPGNA